MVAHTRNRFLFPAVAVLAAVVCAAGSAHSTSLALNVAYTANSLKVTYNGSAVSNGTVIPAGTYQVNVSDDPNSGDQNPNFTINGPGVSYSSNLDSTGMGIDGESGFGPFTFQTSSSYSIEDKNLGASTLVTFMTSSTVSSGPATTTTSTSPSPTPTPIHSGVTRSLGTLAGSLSSSGKVTLDFKGNAVKSLKPGRYTFRVDDHSKKAGLVLEHGKTHITLSGASAVGTRSIGTILSAGRWTIASAGRAKLSFSVS